MVVLAELSVRVNSATSSLSRALKLPVEGEEWRRVKALTVRLETQAFLQLSMEK